MSVERLSLGELVRLEYGKALRQRDCAGFGGVAVMGSNGQTAEHNLRLVEGPGIIVGRKGSAGKVTWVDSDFWASDTTFYVVPRRELDLKWLYFALQHAGLDELAITTGVPGLNRDDAYAVVLDVPPLEEQRRVAHLLEEADGLQRLRKEANEKAHRILSALFAEMFGDPDGWGHAREAVPLAQAVAVCGGKTPSKARPEFWNGDVPWVTPKDMKRFAVSDSEDHISERAVADARMQMLPKGAVLVVVRGMILARHVPIALAAREVCINQDMKALLPSAGFSGEFVVAALTVGNRSLHRLVGTAAHGTRKLDTEDLLAFPIPVPSAREHSAVCSVVRQYSTLLDNGADAYRQLSALRAAMSERLLGVQ